MRIEIDIPKEFEEHFKQDKFKDSLEKIMVDIWHLLENKNCLCANNYQYETIKMLEEALEYSKSAYDVDKVVEGLNKLDVKAIKRYKGGTFGDYEGTDYYIKKSEAIEIVKQGSASDDADNMCEWKKLPFSWFAGCDGRKVEYKQGDYCPRCGKKIKAVK